MNSCHFPVLLAAVYFLGSTITSTDAIAVMSVDLGNEFSKFAVVKPGVPMEIVLNKESQRKTPTVVFLGSDERLFAESGNSKGVRKPAQRFWHLLDLIGKNISHPSVKKYAESFPFHEIEEDTTTGTVVINYKTYKDGEEKLVKLRPEELLGMILEYARLNVENFSEQRVRSGVITVPAHFGQLEREALLRSANLAGIEALQLMNDYAATALQYGIVRLSSFGDAPYYFILFDMGSTHTTATVVSFEKAKSKEDGAVVEHVFIRGVSYSRELSATAVHMAMRSELVRQFEEKTNGKYNIENDPKAMGKMLREAARVVHILSANTEVSSYIEGLVGDTDFSGHASRAELEIACDGIFKLIPGIIKEALDRANIGGELINEIVLMGAGTRIPKVQEYLKQSLEGRKLEELGRGLNTDEAAALGAVYQAAHLSKGFKVKRIVLRDAVIYPVSVEFDRVVTESNKDQEAGIVRRMLFDMSSPFPQKKLITFGKHTSDFSFNVSFAGGFDPTWAVKVANVKEAFDKHSDKVSKGVKAHFAMDESGILHLKTMEAIFDAEENETVPEDKGIFSKFGDKLKGFFSSDDNSTNSTVNSETENTATPNPSNETSTDSEQEKTSTEKPAEPENVVVKTKTVTYRENLTFTIERLGAKEFSEEEMEKSRELVKEYRMQDEMRLQLSKAKNDLESAVIDIKMKLEDSSTKIALKDEEWDQVYVKAKEIGDWLDEEAGPFTPLSDYVDRQSELKAAVKTWFDRLRQAKERPKAIKYLKDTLNSSGVLLQAFVALSENITAETGDTLFSEVELNALQRQIDETKSWFEMMTEAQEKTPDNEDPKLKAEDIKEKAAILEREARYLANKAKAYRPKPKPKPKEKKENESIVINDANSTSTESPEKETSAGTDDNMDQDAENTTVAPETTETPKTTEKEPLPDGEDPTHSPQDL